VSLRASSLPNKTALWWKGVRELEECNRKALGEVERLEGEVIEIEVVVVLLWPCSRAGALAPSEPPPVMEILRRDSRRVMMLSQELQRAKEVRRGGVRDLG
jgi:hypothetical protein